MFKPIADMNKYLILPRTTLVTAVGGGLASGLILVSMGLTSASIPYAVATYVVIAVLFGLYASPHVARSGFASISAQQVGSSSREFLKTTKYASAILLTLTGVLLNLAFDADPRQHAYLSIAAPIVVSALLFGFEAASLALLLACAASFYFFVPPKFVFSFEDPRDIGILCEFVAFVLLCSWIMKSMYEGTAHVQALSIEPLADSGASVIPAHPQSGIANVAEFAATERKLLEANDRYRELRHRVRNEFQTLQLLASAEADATHHPEEFGRWILRLRSAAELHNVLDDEATEAVRMDSYLRALSDTLAKTFGGRLTIETVVEPDICLHPRHARHIGLIYTETAINSLKHAFPQNAPGELRLRFGRVKDGLQLTIADNGVGFNPAAVKEKFGLALMKRIAIDLGGEMEWEASSTGTTVRLNFVAPAPGSQGKANSRRPGLALARSTENADS